MSQQPEKKKSKLLHATTFHVLAAALVLSLSGIIPAAFLACCSHGEKSRQRQSV